MENRSKKGTALVLVCVVLFASAFMVGVSAAGIILMGLAIVSAGYGAGTIMDSPCEMVKK